MELPPYTQEFRFEGEDSPYDGLIVELNLNVDWDFYWKTIDVAGATLVETLMRFGNDVLMSWNLERDGQPVAPDGLGFISQPPHLVRFLLGEWRNAAVNPPPPLSRSPKNTGTSAVLRKRTARR